MNIELRRVAALLGAAALILPSAALAKGKPEDKPVKHAHGKSKPANYVFKGVWHADGTVTVTGGNSRVRKGGFIGQVVAFDVAAAKLRVADSNADAAVTAADLLEGDKVVVKARLPRKEPGTGPFAAHKVVDQTQPVVEVADEVEAVEAVEEAPAPARVDAAARSRRARPAPESADAEQDPVRALS